MQQRPIKMPRGNKRFFGTRPFKKTTEHKTKHEINHFKIDNVSETSGDSISLSEKPSTSKQSVQYPTRTFENRSALEALKTGFWKKPDKDHDAAGNVKKKTQRKQSKRSYVNFNAFNYSDPEDYADADSFSNGPTMRYVDVARSALCSRSSPTPIQKTQQRAPNLDLNEFPYLKSNKTKALECNEPPNEETEEFQSVINENENGVQENDMAADFDENDDEEQMQQPNQQENIQISEEEEEEQLVHPLAFQSLSPYPSSSFVYINPNMKNNFDYVEQSTKKKPQSPLLPTPKTALTQSPLPAANCKPSFVEKFCILENESEYETTSNFGYGAGDYAASSDSCTIQHSENTSEYTEAQSSDGLQRDEANSTASPHCPLNFEWLDMMVQQLSEPFDVEIPNFNYLEAHRDFPRFQHQFEDNNYLRLEERAMFGLRIAENKGFFKDGPYI